MLKRNELRLPEQPNECGYPFTDGRDYRLSSLSRF
jgi:hypothetical protein